VGETVVRSESEVYRWEGPKARMTLSGTMLGTLVLTDERLLFLSTGGNDAARRVRAAALGGALAGELAASRTGALDLSALDAPGSFAVPLDQVAGARAARRWDATKYLSVDLHDRGAPVACALMRKMGMPDAAGWAAGIEEARRAAQR